MIIAAIIGCCLGFVGSIPVAGPIAALVVARGLDGRFRSGVYISLGASVAEALYAFLAFYGFGALLSDYEWITPFSKAGGAVVLVAVGALLLVPRRVSPDEVVAPKTAPPRRAYGSAMLGFSITALNPTLIATWATAVTVVYSFDVVVFSPAASIAFAVGTCVGIAAWFGLLLWLISRFRSRFGERGYDMIRRGTGALVVLVGVVFAVQFVLYFF